MRMCNIGSIGLYWGPASQKICPLSLAQLAHIIRSRHGWNVDDEHIASLGYSVIGTGTCRSAHLPLTIVLLNTGSVGVMHAATARHIIRSRHGWNVDDEHIASLGYSTRPWQK
jgi:hypothetical protein